MKFENVTALAEANLYFDGNVISHTILLSDGSRKTLGVILPGEYHFNTEAAERMEIVAGSCSYVLDDTSDVHNLTADSHFDVPANSGFTITVTEACHYVCSFLE